MQGSRPWMHNGMNGMVVPLCPASWFPSTVALSFSCLLLMAHLHALLIPIGITSVQSSLGLVRLTIRH
jgi:hypothetical protein